MNKGYYLGFFSLVFNWPCYSIKVCYWSLHRCLIHSNVNVKTIKVNGCFALKGLESITFLYQCSEKIVSFHFLLLLVHWQNKSVSSMIYVFARYLNQRVLIEMERKAPWFFLNLSVFEIEKYLMPPLKAWGFAFY